MSDEDVTVTLCTDCAQLHANGETPDEYDEETTELFLAIVAHNTAGYHVIVTCHGECDECDELGCDYGHESFSRSRCGSCGSWLAGDRCPGVLTPGTWESAAAERAADTRMRTWNGNERAER